MVLGSVGWGNTRIVDLVVSMIQIVYIMDVCSREILEQHLPVENLEFMLISKEVRVHEEIRSLAFFIFYPKLLFIFPALNPWSLSVLGFNMQKRWKI